MKIAIVFDGLQVGGIERVGADYANMLCNLGHEVTIVNLNPSLTEMEDEFPGECKIVHCKYPRKLAPEQYAQLIKRGLIFKFAYPIACVVLDIVNIPYRLLCKRKIEFTEKYDLAIAFSGHFNDLTFIVKNYLNARRKMCWLHGALYSYILISDGYLNLYKKIKNLVVLVDDAQEEVLAYNKIHNLNIYKLYNPTFIADKPVDFENVEKLKKMFGRFALMVSRFEYPHKDQYTVAKALEILRTEYGDDINLVFVGTGPDEVKVKEYVESFDEDVKAHIFFEGTRRNVQDYYKAAYLLVHASVAGEGLPTIIIEALANDLPMVVTDSKTGPREILRDNEYGLLCCVKDPKDMAEKTHKLICDQELYTEFQNKGKIRIQDFKPETIQNQLIRIINEIMEG